MKVRPHILIFGDWLFGFNLMFGIFFGISSFGMYRNADQWSVETIVFLCLSAWNWIRIVIRFHRHRRLFQTGKKVVGKVIKARMMIKRGRLSNWSEDKYHGYSLCFCRYEYIWDKRVYRNKIHFFTDNHFPLRERVHVIVDPKKPYRSILTYPFDRIAGIFSTIFALFRIKSK